MERERLGTPLGYRPALDGLRALAIAAVVPYHWTGGVAGIAGGFLGVNLFFVLSGFLITRLLLEEHEETGGISRRGFYQRRFARLMPGYFALLAIVLVVGRVTPIFGSFEAIRIGALSSFFYVTNFVAVARGFGILGPFAHLWSLALEEQFYLIWPIVLIALLPRMSRRGLGLLVALAAAVVFVEIGVRAYSATTDFQMHVGIDGQGMAFLLIGAATAMLFPIGPGFESSRLGGLLTRHGAWLVVPILPFLVAFDHDDNFIYYRGVLALIGVCMAGLLLTVLADPRLSAALGSRPLVWLGRRSYSVYLWHYPLLFVVNWFIARTQLHVGLPIMCLMAGALTIACAELSYRYVEQPFRQKLAGTRRNDAAQSATLGSAPTR